MQPKYASLREQQPSASATILFGDDLANSLKDAEEASRLAKQMPPPAATKSPTKRPYYQKQKPASKAFVLRKSKASTKVKKPKQPLAQ